MPTPTPPWLRHERNEQARHQRDIPKRLRISMPVRRTPRPLGDPMAMLGHPPRARRQRRR